MEPEPTGSPTRRRMATRCYRARPRLGPVAIATPGLGLPYHHNEQVFAPPGRQTNPLSVGKIGADVAESARASKVGSTDRTRMGQKLEIGVALRAGVQRALKWL
jgi:hypothetical protein